MVVFNSRDRQGNLASIKRTWVNSSVIIFAKKTGNISTGITFINAKIYSRCLMHILKANKQNLHFLTFYNNFGCLTACLP